MSSELISTEPATGAILWRGLTGDADEEVAAARGAWAEWAARPFTVRAETMRRFANTVRARADAFADTIARETGKPLWEAHTEVESVIGKVEISISAHSERTAQHSMEGAMGARTAIRHKPHGVLAVLGPYNFPAHLPNGHIAPALLAGNAVVFKPSEKTPASGEFLVDCYHAAGVPPGVLRFLAGGPAEGAALAAHPGVDGLLFTGSARAGLLLHRSFAETPNRILALELGGNNPLVVWDATDLHAAAVVAVQSAFLSAGQRCTAARRLIVRDGAHEPLVALIGKLIDRIIVGEPHAKPQPFMGPVIDNDAADQVEEAFLNLLMAGGRPIKHLARPTPDRPFLSPALIDVTEVADRPDEEIFGPVLQMIRVADFEAAVAEANATRYGLSAALIGGAPELYGRFWGGVRAGVVNWNRPTNGAPPTRRLAASACPATTGRAPITRRTTAPTRSSRQRSSRRGRRSGWGSATADFPFVVRSNQSGMRPEPGTASAGRCGRERLGSDAALGEQRRASGCRNEFGITGLTPARASRFPSGRVRADGRRTGA